MSSNPFDQASRYLAKLDPPALLGWLLRLPPEQVRFRGWLPPGLEARAKGVEHDPIATGSGVARGGARG